MKNSDPNLPFYALFTEPEFRFFYRLIVFNSFVRPYHQKVIEFLNHIDTELFLFLNGIHNEFLDSFMYGITNKFIWIPLYLFIIILTVHDQKKESIWIILGVIILISLSDLIVSGMMKPYFERLRPSRDPDLEGLVHVVNEYRGGSFGFASGHAATSFCLATFIWLALRKQRPWIWILFIWSVVFSYSRIYLGVHYPADILVGALIGYSLALIGYRVYLWSWVLRKAGKGNNVS